MGKKQANPMYLVIAVFYKAGYVEVKYDSDLAKAFAKGASKSEDFQGFHPGLNGRSLTLDRTKSRLAICDAVCMRGEHWSPRDFVLGRHGRELYEELTKEQKFGVDLVAKEVVKLSVLKYRKTRPKDDGFYEVVYVGEGADFRPEVVELDSTWNHPEDCLDKDGTFDWKKGDQIANRISEALAQGKKSGRPLVSRTGSDELWEPKGFLWGRPVQVASVDVDKL